MTAAVTVLLDKLYLDSPSEYLPVEEGNANLCEMKPMNHKGTLLKWKDKCELQGFTFKKIQPSIRWSTIR